MADSSFSSQMLPPMTLSWAITALYLLLTRTGAGHHESGGGQEESGHLQHEHSQVLLVYLACLYSIALAVYSSNARY